MWPEPIPLSALQHWHYCPRQCGLIHLEQAFDDNLHTLRGQAAHARVDKPGVETAKGVRLERALPLWNDALGLVGKADMVEFLPDGTPYPVEYKYGSRNKAADIAACDDLQLAGQALCLESMLDRTIQVGAIFYATSKRRRVQPITAELRVAVVGTARAIRSMLESGQLPAVLPQPEQLRKCKACSLRERCQPDAANANLRAARAALFNLDA